MFTRKEYLENSIGEGSLEAHRRYYRQFVDDKYIEFVVRHIGGHFLLNSADIDFNDIPLRKWDLIPFPSWCPTLAKALGDKCFGSLSDRVCIAKEAARQWVEKTKSEG